MSFGAIARLQDAGDKMFIPSVVSDIFHLTRHDRLENDFITHNPTVPDYVTSTETVAGFSGTGDEECELQLREVSEEFVWQQFARCFPHQIPPPSSPRRRGR